MKQYRAKLLMVSSTVAIYLLAAVSAIADVRRTKVNFRYLPVETKTLPFYLPFKGGVLTTSALSFLLLSLTSAVSFQLLIKFHEKLFGVTKLGPS